MSIKIKKASLTGGRFDNFVPTKSETLSKNEYVRSAEVPSEFVLGKTINKDVAFICPACETETDHIPEHGDTIVCGCGLHMQTFGNGLNVWRKGRRNSA